MQEISTLRQELDNGGLKPRQISAKKDRIELLKMVISYLESGPADDFLKKEIERLINKINLIHADFEKWVPSKYYVKDKDKLNDYLKMQGIPKIRTQLSALRYIADF